MSINDNDFLPGEVSMGGLHGMERLGQLSLLITAENVHDGSPTSREYARLAVKILDQYIEAMDILLASPLLPAADREKIEEHKADFVGKREKAQRAVELNG